MLIVQLASSTAHPASCGRGCVLRCLCFELLIERGEDIRNREDWALNSHLETVTDRGADAWSEQALRLATDNHDEAVIALLPVRRGAAVTA